MDISEENCVNDFFNKCEMCGENSDNLQSAFDSFNNVSYARLCNNCLPIVRISRSATSLTYNEESQGKS